MQLGFWENTYRRNGNRVYVNRIGAPTGTKVWMEKSGQGYKANAKGELGEVDLDKVVQDLEMLLAANKVSQDWAGLEAFARHSGEKREQVSRGRNEPTVQAPSAGMRRSGMETGSRADQALGLDLGTIKVPEQVEIVIDHREPEALLAKLAGLENVTVRMDALPLGDIMINDTILIERKNCSMERGQASDFELSITGKDKRLFNQSERLKFSTETINIIVLEGAVYESSAGMLVQQVDGALSYLMSIQQLSVINTYNLHHTAYMLLKLATHHRSGLGYDLALRANKPKALLDNRRFVLEGLPGVSAGVAEAMLAHFGSIRGIATASVEALMEVPGIGKKRAEGIWAVLQSET